jgi:hypothetical protein
VRLSRGCEYLGFSFVGKRVTIKVSPKKLKAFKHRIKELTGRSRGVSMERRLTDLNRYVRGWIGYFGLARQFAPDLVVSEDAKSIAFNVNVE